MYLIFMFSALDI